MKVRKTLVAASAAMIILTGCGAGMNHFKVEHSKYDHTKSKALNLALLTGLTTEDNPLIVDSKPMTASSGNDSGRTATAIAGGLGLLAGGVGLGLTSALLNKTYQPERSNHVFAWLPKSMAGSDVEAAKVMCDIMNKAAQASLPADFVIQEVKPCFNFRAFSDAQRGNVIISKVGSDPINFASRAEVPEEAEMAYNKELGIGNSYFWSYQKTSADTSPYIDFMPLYLGDKKYDDIKKMRRIRDSIFPALSRNLPSWVYIYISPNKEKNIPAHFLNQGKQLFFISPS